MPERYLLDTNVLLHVVNRSQGWERIVKRFEEVGQSAMAVSAVTVWEIFRMVECAKVSKKLLTASVVLLELFEVEPLTAQNAALGGSLAGWLSNKGLTIGDRDSMIGGTAMSTRRVMVTDNTEEFNRVPGIQVENWRAA